MALIASNAKMDSTGTQLHAQAALPDVLLVRTPTSASPALVEPCLKEACVPRLGTAETVSS
jgi:hypothetical protein